jgi:hypothetical protein
MNAKPEPCVPVFDLDGTKPRIYTDKHRINSDRTNEHYSDFIDLCGSVFICGSISLRLRVEFSPCLSGLYGFLQKLAGFWVEFFKNRPVF